MKIRIIYDSFFGNTEKIAQAIHRSLGTAEDAVISRVNQTAPGDLAGVQLLIVGSPTRAFRPTKAITGFLDKIPDSGLKGMKVAAFDTRIAVADVHSRLLNILVRFFGYAAKPIAGKLMKKGGELITPSEGFFVKGSEGPLKEGEEERAGLWTQGILKDSLS